MRCIVYQNVTEWSMLSTKDYRLNRVRIDNYNRPIHDAIPHGDVLQCEGVQVKVFVCVCVCICICIRGIWVRTTYYGLRLPSTRARTRELGGTTWHFGVEAYRCNPRWGSRTLGPPLAPLRGTRPLLPNNRHHRSYIMHTFPRDITIIELYYVSCYGYTYVH